MGLFFALFIGIFVVTNVNNLPENSQQEEKIIQIKTNKTDENKSVTLETKPQPKEPEPIKEEVKPQPKEPESIKEEVKPQPKEPEPIKEEVTEIVNLDEPGVDWLQIFVLALGVIFVVGSGTYLYKRIKNNSSSGHSNDYMRREFKEKTEPETTEQQPAQEEDQAETTEQQPAQEEDQAETTEQQPVQTESNEEDEKNNK